MKKKLFLVFTLLLACVLIVAACNGDTADTDTTEAGTEATPATTTGTDTAQGTTTDTTPPATEIVVGEEGSQPMHPGLVAALENFPAYTTNDAQWLARGSGNDNIFRVGVGNSGAGFPGLFLATHNEDSFDASFNTLFGSYQLVANDEGKMLSNTGIATFEYDRANNVVIINMQRDVYWHDGTPLTLDDLVFAYEVIAHPEYTGVRYGDTHFINNVQGVDEYRDGTADSIAGLVLSNNNRTLRIYYINPLPPSALFLGGVWLSPIPRHWIEPVIAEVGHEGIQGHIRARDELLGFGPFILDTIVPGESVLMRANDNYHWGAPNVDGIYVRLLPFDMVPAAMRSGEFDFASYQTANLAEFNLMQPTNYQLYGWPTTSTTFINFRLGGMGVDENDNPIVELRTDDHPITNIAIRRALAHAVDRQTVADTVGQGLWVLGPSVLHPFNASEFIDLNMTGFVFDLDLANQILDDAGFTVRDSEGYRLNLDGTPMTFTYGQHSNPTHDVLVPLNIQNWAEIGLRVVMYEGDFLDWGLFTDIVLGAEVGPIDIFAMGWSLGANPAPHGLWSATAPFNMPRYTSPTFEQILYDINSDAAWDPDFLRDAYMRWQHAFYDEVPAIPFTWNLDIIAVNNRVANLSRVRMDTGLALGGGYPANWFSTTWGNSTVALTAPAPFVDGQ